MAQTLQKIYSDLDLTFTRNPVTGDVSFSYDDQAVIRSVRNLLLTNFYERPMQPGLGSNMTSYLFEPTTPVTASMIDTEIRDVVKNFEPRATIDTLNVVVVEDKNAFFVDMSFFIGNNSQPTSINLLLERRR